MGIWDEMRCRITLSLSLSALPSFDPSCLSSCACLYYRMGCYLAGWYPGIPSESYIKTRLPDSVNSQIFWFFSFTAGICWPSFDFFYFPFTNTSLSLLFSLFFVSFVSHLMLSQTARRSARPYDDDTSKEVTEYGEHNYCMWTLTAWHSGWTCRKLR